MLESFKLGKFNLIVALTHSLVIFFLWTFPQILVARDIVSLQQILAILAVMESITAEPPLKILHYCGAEGCYKKSSLVVATIDSSN